MHHPLRPACAPTRGTGHLLHLAQSEKRVAVWVEEERSRGERIDMDDGRSVVKDRWPRRVKRELCEHVIDLEELRDR